MNALPRLPWRTRTLYLVTWRNGAGETTTRLSWQRTAAARHAAFVEDHYGHRAVVLAMRVDPKAWTVVDRAELAANPGGRR